MSKTETKPKATAEALVSEGKYEDAVVALVEDRDYVTFIEIGKLLESRIKTTGDNAMMLGSGDHNIVMWAGMSEQFFELVEALIAAKRIFLHPATFLTYMIDGGGLQLPLAKRAQKYKKLHWIPVCFRIVPLAGKLKPQGEK